MTINLNHTIISAHDKDASAGFMSGILGLDAPRHLGHFVVVDVGLTSLDFVSTSDPIAPRHFAFLVSDEAFDQIFARIQARGLAWWADPGRTQTGQINTYDDGRGLYFDDPNGHLLEIITRPYGSGGLAADNPNPLLFR